MAIGDVNSNARGSGARYNEGKDPMELVPVRFWLRAWVHQPAFDEDMEQALAWLMLVQERQDPAPFHFRTDQLEAAMRVLDYGRKKYAAWNWSKGQPWSVTIDCALRHLRAVVMGGQEMDAESGEPHMGHVYCNVLFLDWFRAHYPEGDDLPPREAFEHAQ